MTVMLLPITPAIAPVEALSEFNTCVGGQKFSQIVSLVSSLGTKELLAKPTGHAEQELASINGPVLSGDDMYLLAEQHPYLAILVPVSVKAFFSSGKVSHLLPHNVRLNPLFVNTAKKQKHENIKKY